MSITKIFRDPIHNVIDLDTGDRAVNDLIIRLIDSREFQRLRFIKQLGFVYLAYPSAMHSRFEHSIGVAFLAKRFLEKITSMEENMLAIHDGSERDLFAEFFSQIKNDKPVTIVAALLHDIGHGPLSHVFEEIMGTTHEKWTKEIILGNTEVNALLTAYSVEYPEKICSILFEPSKPSPSSHIIAGQLDVDRIDYLLRDSHMTGSGYGKFDVEWLFNVLTVGIMNNRVRIGLDAGKGASVAEAFVMARIYMFKNIYLHKTGMVAQSMLKLLLERISELHDAHRLFPNENLKRLMLFYHNTASAPELLTDYLAVSDIDLYYLLNSLRNSNDEVLHRLTNGLLDRRLFRRIDEQYWHEIEIYITNKKGLDMARYFMIQVHMRAEKITCQPSEGEILLFDKNGVGFTLHEISNVIPTKARDESLNMEYYIDWDTYNQWRDEVLYKI